MENLQDQVDGYVLEIEVWKELTGKLRRFYGKLLDGKSSTGNNIIGSKEFGTKRSSSGVTTTSELSTTELEDGRVLNVINTPEEENVVVSSLVAMFRTKIFDFIIMVFTGGDELEDYGKSLQDFLHDSPESLKVEVLYVTSLRDFSNSKNRKQNGLSEAIVIVISVVSTVAAITLMFFTALLCFRNRRLGFIRTGEETSTYYSSSLSSRLQKRPLFLNGVQHEMTSDGKTSWKLQTI
uniref:AIG1-type G domain-containing protein n=1 Tax=Tanacetum cinerariifolium TaxID=118510 RepID=A0A6L2JNK0_TANCI|nr:hypothetical protein [Tanacetum cinerariifolium]